jgi:hypothetical protein
MLEQVRRVLAFELTIAEWIGTAVLLAVPAVVLLALLTWVVMVIPGVCAA